MNKLKLLAVLPFITLGAMALTGCPSNSNNPSAPVTVVIVETPTYPPCVMNGFTCTPSLTPTFTLTFTSTPTLTVTPTLTPTPADWVITSPVTLASGQYSYVSVHVEAGGTLNVQGAVTVSVSGFFAQDAGTTITGDGNGYPIEQGPGAPTTWDAAGGSHGGLGGADYDGATPGPVYDSSTAPASMGSGGGAGPGQTLCSGSGGGGLLDVNASGGTVTLNGIVSMNGVGACSVTDYEGYGGGAGGTIYIQAQTITGSGLLRANGAAGASYTYYNNGGGGGGGIIVLSTHSSNTFSGTLSVSGGAGGNYGGGGTAANGSAGITNTTTY